MKFKEKYSVSTFLWLVFTAAHLECKHNIFSFSFCALLIKNTHTKICHHNMKTHWKKSYKNRIHIQDFATVAPWYTYWISENAILSPCLPQGSCPQALTPVSGLFWLVGSPGLSVWMSQWIHPDYQLLKILVQPPVNFQPHSDVWSLHWCLPCWRCWIVVVRTCQPSTAESWDWCQQFLDAISDKKNKTKTG